MSDKKASTPKDASSVLEVKVVNQPETKKEQAWEDAHEYHDWKIEDEDIDDIEIDT